MIDILHSRGPGACGGVAFHCRHRPAAGERIIAADIVLVDLTEPSPGTAMVCGTCGHVLPSTVVVTPEGGWSNSPGFPAQTSGL